MEESQSIIINRKQRKSIIDRYRRDDKITKKKLLNYIPVMILTNLSTLLLVSVDGIVVGNYIGADALSSVNIFYPASALIGVLSDLVAIGIATTLSDYIGRNNREKIEDTKKSAKWIMCVASIIATLIQIPIIYLIISTYGLSEEMYHLTWSYAIGIMIATPFGLISTVGSFELQIVGKMRLLMWLTVIEGGTNLLLDLLFVGPLHLGIAGAGYGTMIANVIRCTLTIIFIAKKTDIFNSKGAKVKKEDVINILTRGIPEASDSLMMALQTFFLIKIILYFLGEDGGAVRGVCAFAISVSLVLINSIQASARPLAGIFIGGKDWFGARLLVRQTIILNVVLVGGFTLLCVFFPGVFYWINGVKDVMPFSYFMLILCAMHFVFKGINGLFRMYFSYMKDMKFTTILTVLGNAAIPIFAFILATVISAPWLWAAYLISESIMLVFNVIHYQKKVRKYAREGKEDLGLFYLTIKPDEAVSASKAIHHYANDIGVKDDVSYKIGLCVEDMVTCAQKSQKRDDITIQIMIRFTENEAIFTMLDDGEYIALDKNSETKEIIEELLADNYSLIKRLAKNVEYQYILNMNYTVIEF